MDYISFFYRGRNLLRFQEGIKYSVKKMFTKNEDIC